MFIYISNTAHYKDVLSRVRSVKHMLWIGTADIKDLFCAKFSMSARSMIVVQDLCEAVAAVFILAERVVNQY